MTMPGRIYRKAYVHTETGEIEFSNEVTPSREFWADAAYIRADLTNDLIEALETIHSQTNDGLARRIAGDALIRYRALAD